MRSAWRDRDPAPDKGVADEHHVHASLQFDSLLSR
jgi:hypothetical protein